MKHGSTAPSTPCDDQQHLLLALLGMSGAVSDVLGEAGIDYLDARRALRGASG